MIVVGIDPSLRCTGIAVFSTQLGLVAMGRARTDAVEGLVATRRRIRVATSRIVRLVPEGTDVVVIESPSARSQYGSHNERVGLYWFVVDQLLGRGIHVIPIGPTSRAKYATGNGNANKKAVLAAVRATFPDHKVPDDNVADALALAGMGLRWLGAPVDGVLSPKQQEAYDAVSWPEMERKTA